MSPALPPDVRYLMQHRVELLGLGPDDEDSLRAHRLRARAAGADRRWTAEAEQAYWERYRAQRGSRAATVGGRIARERLRLHMSVGDLAEVVGMWEVEVEMIEDGSAEASEAQLVDIACALFTSVAVLTGEEEPRV